MYKIIELKPRPRAVLIALLLSLIAGVRSASARPVTMESLLREMTDRDAAAQWPALDYTCKEVSSHDPRKKDPADPAGWHSNQDYGNFIRLETNEDRREWVILDAGGPGAIIRIWAPLSADKDQQIVRFYFDGSSEPAIAVKLNELLAGQSFVRPPLAFISWNEPDLNEELKPDYKAPRGVGGDLYLPIPFAKSCKVTLDSVPFYYCFNYRLYVPSASVKTFTMADYEAAKTAVNQAGATLLADPALADNTLNKQSTLAPGEELAIDLPKGSAAVRNLQAQVLAADAPQVLRSIVLEATFDGEPAVWCPISEFFGVGTRLHPVHDWSRSVTADGTLTARWIMPYQHSGRLALKNLGHKPARVKLGASTSSWSWTKRSLYFHANWHAEFDTKTRPIFDWNYIQIRGRAVYAGDTLTVFSPVKAWYGEGDERIYVDGESLPSHIGTGTEDYYGYAWGMPNYFSSPFISTPERDNTDRGDWRGYTTDSRLRLLDVIPVHDSLNLDMEIWDWADTQVDYAAATFWYARPGTESNRGPQPLEVARALREPPPDPVQFKIQDALECETMPIVAQSAGLRAGTQDAGLNEGQWSGGQQLFVQATRVGDFVTLAMPAAVAQPRAVTVFGTKSRDYGVLRFSVNGQTAGKDYDAYAPEAVTSGPIELGTFQAHDGKLLLRVEVVGSNPAATGARCFFGLDCVVLRQPAPNQEGVAKP